MIRLFRRLPRAFFSTGQDLRCPSTGQRSLDNGGNVGTTRRSFGRGPVFPQGGGRKHVEPRGDKGENRREIRKVGREEKLFASLQRFNVTSAFGECMPPLRKSCKSRRVPLSSRANLLPFLSSSSWGPGLIIRAILPSNMVEN